MSTQLPLSNAIERRDRLISFLPGDKTDQVIDLTLMMLVTALAFALTYHPYFFGDELILHRLAAKHNYAFWPLFLEINTYKPRLVGNGIMALLAQWQMERWATATLQVGCVIWINALLYGAVRYLFAGDRLLAWLLIATVLTSRYVMVFYYDYSSGLLDILSTALLLSALMAAWLAWRKEFAWRYAGAALAAAVMCIFVHERYVAGLLAAGLAIAIAECVGPSARRRKAVIVWALALGVVPLLLFSIANTVFGSLSITTGTAGEEIALGWDTLWTALMYGYDVFLGGNYGQAFLWGTYNHLHPEGRILGWCTVAVTAVLTAVIVLRKGIAWQNRWVAAGLAAVALAMIAVASLPGSQYLQPRWMFPVGILVTMAWIIMVKGAWRHVAIAAIMGANLIYLLSGSHNAMAQVYASRSARSLAASLLAVVPGKSGIVVGNDPDSWTIGSCCAIDMGPRPGDTFSRVSLNSALHIDPIVPRHAFDPAQYDFGLAFVGVSPDLTGRYRPVSVHEAFVIAGLADSVNMPVAAAQAAAPAPNRSEPSTSTQPTRSNPPTSLDTVTPASGSGKTQTFTATYSHTGGGKNIVSAWFLVENGVTGTHACFLEYNSSNQSVRLMSDAGDKWLPAAPAGSKGALNNSQCSVDLAGVHGVALGDNLTVTWPLTFTSHYAGPKQIFLWAPDPTLRTQWVKKGSWVVQ